MLRSLFSGISGLRSHQTMLDVTGNNIANVNTVGYKSSQVQFQDTLSQILAGGTTPVEATGGRNPSQVGLGVQVSGITANFAQGAAQATSKPSDMMINGDGFFIVNVDGQEMYSRAGSFTFDADGRLVTPTGAIVQGHNAVNGVVSLDTPLVDIKLPVGATVGAVRTSEMKWEGNLPSETPVGGSIHHDLHVHAADGAQINLGISMTRTATGWTASLTLPAPAGPLAGDVALDFDAAGQLISPANGLVTFDFPSATEQLVFDMSDVTGYAGLSSLRDVSENGREAGTLDSYNIGPDGVITGTYTNGVSEAISRISLATFTNPTGLQKAGGNLFEVSVSSGAITYGFPDELGNGALSGGYLEMSNVDLSAEFTNLIIAQRGFQANARIITTSDEILQELANLKR